MRPPGFSCCTKDSGNSGKHTKHNKSSRNIVSNRSARRKSMNEKDLSQKVYTCVGLVSPFIDITQVYIYYFIFTSRLRVPI